MTDVLGVIVGLIGGWIFYKFISQRFICFAFGLRNTLIVPISIYLVGFFLTIIIFAPIISVIGGTVYILLWIIKTLIKACLIFVVASIAYRLVKKIICN